MGKGGKTQQSQAQSQKKGGGQQNFKQTNNKPSRGCCGCIFSLIKKLIVLTLVSSFLYVATFTGYHYHVKQRVPTVDEFKAFSTEMYIEGSKRASVYYNEGEKHAKVYYAHFEKEHLPTIQLYTKKWTKLAVEKAGELKELSVKYFDVAQKQVGVYYRLALEKIAELSGDSKAEAPKAQPPKATPPTSTTPKPTQAPQKPTQAPTPVPKAATQKPAETTKKPGSAERKKEL